LLKLQVRIFTQWTQTFFPREQYHGLEFRVAGADSQELLQTVERFEEPVAGSKMMSRNHNISFGQGIQNREE
jgi:hypothetical protein